MSSILGMFSTLGGYHEYIGEDIMSTSGDIMSTLEDFMSTSGGYHDVCGGYHEYIGGCSVHQGFQYKLKGFCPPHAS